MGGQGGPEPGHGLGLVLVVEGSSVADGMRR